MKRKEKIHSLCIDIGPYNEFEASENVSSKILSRRVISHSDTLVDGDPIYIHNAE